MPNLNLCSWIVIDSYLHLSTSFSERSTTRSSTNGQVSVFQWPSLGWPMPAYCFKPSIRQTWIFSSLIVEKSSKAIYWEGATGVACWVFEPCYCRSPPVPPLVLPIFVTSAWWQSSRHICDLCLVTKCSWWALRLHSHLMFHSQAVSLLSKPGYKPRTISRKCNSSWKGGHAFIPKRHSCNCPVDPSPGLIQHPRLP